MIYMENMEENNMSLEEFDSLIKKRKEKRHHKLKNSWGEYDFYKWLRKRGWKDVGRPVTEKEFYILMNSLFTQVSDKIVEGESLELPYWLGIIELAKKEGTTSYKNNKLITNYQIDWQKTIKLWYEDKEAMRKKQLVRIVEKDIYKILYYRKVSAFIALFPSRNLKQKVKKAIQNNELDAFEYRRKKQKTTY